MNLSSAAPMKLVAVMTPATLMSFSTRTCPVRVEMPETSRVVIEPTPPITLNAVSASSAVATLRILIFACVMSPGSGSTVT